MEDLTKRIVAALRRAVISARNADEAREAAELADMLDAEGAPIMVPATATLNVDATPGVLAHAEPFPHPDVAPAVEQKA